MNPPPQLHVLLHALAEHLQTAPLAEREQFTAALTQAAPHNPPVLAYLDEVLALGQRGPLRDMIPMITALATLLPWTTFYRETDLTRPFLANFAILELVGPRGPVVAQDTFVVLFLLGPHTWYPFHQHTPEEVYTVVAGSVQIHVDGAIHERQAGDHHYMRAHAPHGLQTRQQPFLALSTWIGNMNDPVLFNIGEDAIRMPLLPQYTPREVERKPQ